jgi:type IV secretion system protein VirB10
MFLRPLIATAFLAGLLATLLAALLAAQDGVPVPAGDGLPKVDQAKTGEYTVASGTKVPLSLINTISTKHSSTGDSVYLETSFPILVGGRIVIPVGSYVAGTVTQLKKPGRVKGRGELYVRFDSLTLPNGVTRDFRARMGGMDGAANGELDKSEGKVKSEGNKAGDARTVGEAAGAGASIGAIAGNAAGHAGMGAGIGAAAGAAAGLIGVLVTRGPDAVLSRGTTVEMVLDRSISFNDSELNFGGYQPPRKAASGTPAPGSGNDGGLGTPARRFPW